MRKPKIIVWDIEVMRDLEAIDHNFFDFWVPYKNNGFSGEMSSILCIGWKELHSKKVHCINAWDSKTRWDKNINDDSYVLKEFSKVLTDADGMITHNGKNFDLKFLNTRLALHGMPFINKMPHMDTKTIASRNFSFLNNRLGHLAESLKTDLKMDNGGAQLWRDVRNRKKSALKTMTKYCKHDVMATQGIFNKLKPFASNIPNYNLFTGDVIESFVCPSCGGDKLQKNGKRRTKTMIYQRYRCNDCGSSSKTNTKDQRPVSI